MSSIFKNYSLTEVIYLLIRFNETNFFPRNTKNTDRNGVNKQNTHTRARARTSVWWKIRLVSMKINDTLFFKTPPIWPAPPFLWEKSEPHPFFCENWENSTLPLFKVNNKNTKLMSLILIWICSKSTIKGPERPQLNHLIPTENILVLLRIPSYVTPELYFLK